MRPPEPASSGQMLRVWFGVGIQSFGGGVATLALIHQAFVEGHEHDAESLYAQTLPEIVFVMQSLETLTCYGKRIAAWRMGFDVQHDRGARATPFGIECARRFAQRLGPTSRVLRR